MCETTGVNKVHAVEYLRRHRFFSDDNELFASRGNQLQKTTQDLSLNANQLGLDIDRSKPKANLQPTLQLFKG